MDDLDRPFIGTEKEVLIHGVGWPFLSLRPIVSEDGLTITCSNCGLVDPNRKKWWHKHLEWHHS